VSRVRVAFVHEHYPLYRHELFGLLAQRHEVEFYFVNESPRRLPPHSHTLRGFRIPEMADFVVAPGLTRAVLGAHEERPFDLILGSDLGSYATLAAFRAARIARRPFVLWSGEWVATRHPRRWLSRPLEALVVRRSAASLAYGSRAAAYLEHLGAPRDTISQTGNTAGYVFDRDDRAHLTRIRFEWGIGDRPVVLFLGRLIPVKSPDLLLRAFVRVAAKRPEIFLVVAGEGPMLPALEHQTERLGLTSVHFTRRAVVGKAEKDMLFSLAEVFVLPSRRARVAEAWGLVLNEAANAGLPIVVSETVGAVGDLIRPGISGLVVPDTDEPALEAAILHLLTDRDKARRLGAAAKQAEAMFTVERMAEAFDRAFARAMEGTA
jgi:glycosyltransferase involved in cell wall biosynthesis